MSLDIMLTAVRPTVVFQYNITHNLSKMAEEAYSMRAFHNDQKIKAINSVEKVNAWFLARGFQVSKANNIYSNGSDLVISKNGQIKRVEVKSASKTTRSWRVGAVNKKSNDDIIAIVFDNGAVFVEPMSDHLAKCSADGSRRITKLEQIYG